MKKFLVIVAIQLLAGTLAFAKPGLGVKETGPEFRKSFIISDFSNFSPDIKDAFGLCRYGLGRGQVELGSPSGIFAEANNGILLSDTEGLIGGIEPVNGTLSYHNTAKLEWRPGASLGYTKSFMYVAGRALYSVANNSDKKQGLGVGAVIQLGPLVYWENPGTKIYSLNLKNNVNFERRMDSLSGETYMFVVREGF